MPGVSADVFITLVLALLCVTAILTAGVDMRSPDPRGSPRASCMTVLFYFLANVCPEFSLQFLKVAKYIKQLCTLNRVRVLKKKKGSKKL